MRPDREHLADRKEGTASLDSRLLADFDAAVRCAVERAEAGCRAAGPDADLGARFEASLLAVLQAAAANPDQTRLCLVEAPGLGPRALEHKDAALQRFVELLERELAAGSDAGAPPLVAEMVIGGIYEVLQRQVRAGQLAELPGLVAELRDLWLPVLRDR